MFNDDLNPSEKVALNNAFAEGPSSLTIYELDDEEKVQIQGFALQTTAYYNLEYYLKVAATLPSSRQRFEELYPKDNMEELIRLDSNIYNELSKCLVDVNEHCSDFSLKTFGSFHTISQNIILFCETFAKRVQSRGALADQIKILADESIPEGDKKLANAVKISQYILNLLSEESRKREEETKKLLGELAKFRVITEADKVNVGIIHEKLVGPRKTGKSYFEILLASLAQTQRQMEDKLNDLEKKEATKKKKLATAPAYLLLGAIGIVVATVSVISALKIDLDYYKREVERERAANKVLVDNINCIANICKAVTKVDQTIGDAISSLQSFEKTFGRLRASFQLIKDRIGNISEDTRADDPVIRAMAEDNLREACEKWHEVRRLAEGFVSFKPRVVKSV